MDFCGWTYIGPMNWWELLTPEAKAAWVSALGTVLAAGIAAWVYIGTNRRHEKLRREDAATAKAERDLRERVVLQYVLTEMRSIAMRMEDAIVCCVNKERRMETAKAAFIQLAFIVEKQALEALRPSLIIVPPEIALSIAECEAEIAIFNTEVRRLEATWTANAVDHESSMLYTDIEFLKACRPGQFSFDELEARKVASLACVIAIQVQHVAAPIARRLELESPSWKAIFDRCASHMAPIPAEEKSVDSASKA